MNLATLDRRVGTEGPTDDLAQRLGAVDNEQPTDLRVETAVDQIVDERLHDRGILGRAFDQGERMFAAESAATSTRSLPMCKPSSWTTSRSSLDRSDAIHSASRSA